MERPRSLTAEHMKLLAQRMHPLEDLLKGLHDPTTNTAERALIWEMLQDHRQMQRHFDALASRRQEPDYQSRTKKP